MSYPRLDERADHIVKSIAQSIAYEFGLEYVGTEHILLAILRHGDNVGAKVLLEFGLDEHKVRAHLDELMQKAKEDTWVFGRLPGSPHYRNVVAVAIDEAAQLESKSIGPEHLLLALLREKGSTAQRLLDQLGVTLEKCREKLLERLK